MNQQAFPFFSALLSGLLTAACTTTPPPNFYMLDAAAPSHVPGFEQGLSVGVGPVEIADHLNRNQIVTRASGTKLNVSEQNQWVEPLKAGFTRVLLVNLGLNLDSNRIYALPMRRRRPLDYQVSVDVLRFDGVLGKEVVLGTRWTLLSGDGKEVLLSKVTRVQEPVQGNGVSEFVAAQSRAVIVLSREIAAAIQDPRD